MKKKRLALVTGGAGFIGSHLVDALLEQGLRVIAADNLVTGRPENLAHLKEDQDFRLVEWDVTQDPPPALKKDLSRASFIFHLASPASPSEFSPLSYLNYPEETALVNTVGTFKLLNLALESKALFLFASSSEIYGDPEIHPQTEEYAGRAYPLGPRACYYESKRMGETWVKIFVRYKNVDGRVVRIFNTYGPRSHPHDGRVVSTFILQALRGNPLSVHGDGSQTRSFCYIADLVEGILGTAKTPTARGEVFNLGRPEEYTILETAKTIKELTGSESEIVFTDRPIGDPNRRKPDITKAKKLLGWEPRVSFREGLKPTIAYYQKLR